MSNVYTDKEASYSLTFRDCLDAMRSVTDQSLDLILVDPPHGRTQCQWDEIIPLDQMWSHYRRLIKPGGTILIISTQPYTSQVVCSNPPWFRYAWVWEKSKASGWLNAKRRPMPAHEEILVFSPETPRYYPQMREGAPYDKGLVKAQSSGDLYGKYGRVVVKSEGTRYPRSVLYFRTAESEGNWHKNQKPVALLEYLIKTYTQPGELVMDNAMGSASTGIACLNTGRKFLGMESDPIFFQRCLERFKGAGVELTRD